MSSARPEISTAERRRRIAVRHHVAPACRASDLVALANDVVGVHATDPASVYLGIRARASAVTHDDIARALYEDRSLLRILGMRRTMFVVSRENASVIQSAVAHVLGLAERKRLVGWLDGADVIHGRDAESWLSEVEAQTVAVLDELGEATAAELSKRVPGLRIQIPFGEGKTWAGQVGVSTRVLFLLATEGRIIRGQPRGTWLSSLYAWAPTDRWVPGGLARHPVREARAELVRRWLRSFGPGTRRDVQWWTGWTVRDTQLSLADTGALEVGLDDGTGYVLPDDLAETPEPEPWIGLLPALDTTTMGWADRDWYLGAHRKALFDTNGNAGPALWMDGRVVGGWGQRPGGEIGYRLLEDVGREATLAIEAEAARVHAWLGGKRIIPRFRTPVEAEMAA